MAFAYHFQQEAAASLAAQPPNDEQKYQPQPQPHLKAGDVCVGCIVWLLPRNSQEESMVCKKDGCDRVLRDAGYNHPVVVLGIRQRENSTRRGDIECSVACVTSFSSTPLDHYLQKRRHNRYYQESLPIFGADAELLDNPGALSVNKLFLENGRLRKQSYVTLEHTYNVPVSMLAQYARTNCRAYKMRLKKTSYNDLMGQLRLSPEPFEETATLYETESRRLSALANPVRRTANMVPYGLLAMCLHILGCSQYFSTFQLMFLIRPSQLPATALHLQQKCIDIFILIFIYLFTLVLPSPLTKTHLHSPSNVNLGLRLIICLVGVLSTVNFHSDDVIENFRRKADKEDNKGRGEPAHR